MKEKPFVLKTPTPEEEERYQAWLIKRREEIKADYEAEYGKDDEPCPFCDEYICECED